MTGLDQNQWNTVNGIQKKAWCKEIKTASWFITIEDEFDFKLLHQMLLYLNVQILHLHILGWIVIT